MQEIARGAEAVLSRDGDSLIKERIVKGYRLKPLDELLRTERTKMEARLLDAARRAGVPAPVVRETETYVLKMDFVDGPKLRDILDAMPREQRGEIAATIGRQVGKLHRNGIVHGDLTTSNMLLDGTVLYFIDFGLGFFSKNIEDRAMDLYLLHNALKSTHYKITKELWSRVTEAYGQEVSDATEALDRFKKIARRGRYARRIG